MQRFGVDEALIGDLVEQRRAGRSVAWVWLQALGAIAAVVVHDIGRRPARAVLAIVLGLMLREAHKMLWSVLWHYTNSGVAKFLPVGLIPLGVALSWTNLLMAIPGWIMIGWLLARLNGPTLVAPYVVMSFVLIAPDLWRQAGNAIEDVRFRPYFYITTVREMLFTIGVLAGSLWSRGRRYAIE